MPISTTEIIETLKSKGINPTEDEFPLDDLPEIGVVSEQEDIYTTSVDEIFEEHEQTEWPSLDNPRIRDWSENLDEIIEQGLDEIVGQEIKPGPAVSRKPVSKTCAWYCPIHFFGHGWGIYIRENCILDQALEIAKCVNWKRVSLSKQERRRQILRGSFYLFFLHEQFHHKVESLGFRLLVSTNNDRYRNYKTNVYKPTYNTPACLEESLANAESYIRLNESRYTKKLDGELKKGMQQFLRLLIPLQPPGYSQGLNYLGNKFRRGLFKLQSQMLEGNVTPSMNSDQWAIAPKMITSLKNINDKIYLILPKSSQPILGGTQIDPGSTASTRALERALTTYYGYSKKKGGKGNHVKLVNQIGQISTYLEIVQLSLLA